MTAPSQASRQSLRHALGQRLKSFHWAWRGLVLCWEGPNFRIQCAFGAIALLVASLLGFSLLEWALLATASALVLALECANTALEHLVNLVSPQQQPLAGRAKDAAAAAVLVASGGAALTGLLLCARHL